MANFAPGDRVGMYSQPNFGNPSVRWSTVERVTKTQYVLTNGLRYRREDLREVGRDRWGSNELIAADDPRATMAAKAQERQALVTALWSAWEGWHRDRRATPAQVALAAQALVDYDQSVTP